MLLHFSETNHNIGHILKKGLRLNRWNRERPKGSSVVEWMGVTPMVVLKGCGDGRLMGHTCLSLALLRSLKIRFSQALYIFHPFSDPGLFIFFQ